MKVGMSELNIELRIEKTIDGNIEQLLGKLSQKGAFVKWDTENRADKSSCEIVLTRNGVVKSIVAMPKKIAEQAKQDGLLKRCNNSDDWQLSRKGARALRAVRSAGGGVNLAATGQQNARPLGPAAGTKTKDTCADTTKCQINDAESPLAWLRRRKGKDGAPMLSEAQFNAGEKLRADFWLGQMTPRVTANWSATSTGRSSRRRGARAAAQITDSTLAARQRIRKALEAVGPELSGVLIDVCCHLKGLEMAERAAGWPKRSGKILLQKSLSALSRHYGMTSDFAPHLGKSGIIGHWGTDGYRPLFDDE